MNKQYNKIYTSLIMQWNAELLKEASSSTDYTPDQFLNKIFNDVKSKGMNNDFLLQYTLKDFQQYVHQKSFSKYKEFIQNFKGKNKDHQFVIVILNWAIFDNQKLIQQFNKFDTVFKNKNSKEKITFKEYIKIKRQIKRNFKKIYKKAANPQRVNELLASCQTDAAFNIIQRQLNEFYRNNQNFNIPDSDQTITGQEMLNEQINAYVKYLKSGSETLETHNLTNGFMLTLDNNFTNMSGFLLFLNRNRKGNLSDLKALLNHQLDHYFDIVINKNDDTTEQDNKALESHYKDNKAQAKYAKYLFGRSEFNSRSTDVCNYLLNNIIPVSGKNALTEFIKTIEANPKRTNELIPEAKKWFKPQNTDYYVLKFSLIAYRVFPKKWEILKNRLTQEFQKYKNMTQEEREKYAKEIQAEFSQPTSKQIKAVNALAKQTQNIQK